MTLTRAAMAAGYLQAMNKVHRKKFAINPCRAVGGLHVTFGMQSAHALQTHLPPALASQGSSNTTELEACSAYSTGAGG